MNLLRKYIVFSLVMLITLSASGISISIHKCCNKIKDISFFGSDADCKMSSKPKAKPSCSDKHEFNPEHKGKACCSDQKVTVQKTTEATVYKSQVKEKNTFDVLFALNFVRNWLGFASQEDEDAEQTSSSPGFSVTGSLTILFRQFRI